MENPRDPFSGLFTRHELSQGCCIYSGCLPAELALVGDRLEETWNLQPSQPQQIRIGSRWLEIPRRQKAYLRKYTFSGQTSQIEEIPLPASLVPYWEWAKETVDSRLNGLLLNWYNGSLGHYIGPHHDDTRQLVPGSPIVTISLGEERIFRLTRQTKVNGRKSVAEVRDFPVQSGSVLILPWETNLAWKHSVPRFARYRGQRISITLRVFR